MPQQASDIESIYIQHFREIYSRCTPELMASVNAKINPKSLEIAEVFYAVIMDIQDSDGFLTKDLVQSQLLKTMSRWLQDLFTIRNDKELELYINTLLAAGSVHARINLPPHLFNCGVRILKQEVCVNQGFR